jgi:hypothetical protein
LTFIVSVSEALFWVWQKEKTTWVLAFDECTAHERFIDWLSEKLL